MRKIAPLILSAFFLSACSSINCPLNNTVYTVYGFYDNTDSAYTIADSLTVTTKRTAGNDTTLINKITNTSSIILPMSYTQAEDILFFCLKDTLNNIMTDTVRVSKDNFPHFESVDCSPVYFHKITKLEHTNHAIDSIIISNNNVNYETDKPHFKVYFKPLH